MAELTYEANLASYKHVESIYLKKLGYLPQLSPVLQDLKVLKTYYFIPWPACLSVLFQAQKLLVLFFVTISHLG